MLISLGITCIIQLKMSQFGVIDSTVLCIVKKKGEGGR